MSAKVKVSGAWKDSELRVKVSGAWKNVEKGFVKVSGAWKVFYDLVTSLTLDNVSYDSVSFDPQASANQPYAFIFSPDGLTLYVADETTDDIFEYTCSTAFRIGTAGTGTSVLATGLSAVTSLQFNNTGSELYCGYLDGVKTFSLSTNYDISTGTSLRTTDLSANLSDFAFGATFSPDGTILYLCENGLNRLKYWDCSTAFDSSTATYGGLTPTLVDGFGTIFNSKFLDDGFQIITVSNLTNDLHLYDLAVAGDATSGVTLNSTFSDSFSSNFRDLYLTEDKIILMIVNDVLRQYSIN